MAKKANQAHHQDNLEGIEIALTRTEQFIEDNSKPISYIILGHRCRRAYFYRRQTLVL